MFLWKARVARRRCANHQQHHGCLWCSLSMGDLAPTPSLRFSSCSQGCNSGASCPVTFTHLEVRYLSPNALRKVMIHSICDHVSCKCEFCECIANNISWYLNQTILSSMDFVVVFDHISQGWCRHLRRLHRGHWQRHSMAQGKLQRNFRRRPKDSNCPPYMGSYSVMHAHAMLCQKNMEKTWKNWIKGPDNPTCEVLCRPAWYAFGKRWVVWDEWCELVVWDEGCGIEWCEMSCVRWVVCEMSCVWDEWCEMSCVRWVVWDELCEL